MQVALRRRRLTPLEAELLQFVAMIAPALRLLASRWGNGRWGIPGVIRISLRRMADQADDLLRQHWRR